MDSQVPGQLQVDMLLQYWNLMRREKIKVPE